MSIDDRDIAFNTGLNYLKRHLVGTESHTFGGSFGLGTTTVAHNLGYIPAVRVFYEYNGLIFESAGQSQTPPPAANNSWARANVTTSNLVVTCGNGSGAATTVKVHYIIYLDSAS